ncbi:MAG TPA: transposase [Terriglobales bacterium]|nr:transposase [Terriglobales bacterium]
MEKSVGGPLKPAFGLSGRKIGGWPTQARFWLEWERNRQVGPAPALSAAEASGSKGEWWRFRTGRREAFSCLWAAQRFHRCDRLAKARAASAAEVPSMAAHRRGNTGYSCYFITASTFQKQNILQTDRMAGLFVDVLLYYRQKQQYLLHEFVVMPDHFHLLITPQESLERAMQLIKGGFSFRAKRELGFRHEIWQPASMIGGCGMQKNISPFESTSDRTF